MSLYERIDLTMTRSERDYYQALVDDLRAKLLAASRANVVSVENPDYANAISRLVAANSEIERLSAIARETNRLEAERDHYKSLYDGARKATFGRLIAGLIFGFKA